MLVCIVYWKKDVSMYQIWKGEIMSKKYDLVILGAGPAGITAGIYGVRAGLETVLLEKSYVTGGQVLNTYEVDNYPGISHISGLELGEAFENHAKSLGLCIEQGEAAGIHKEDGFFQIVTEEKTYLSRTVIIAAGAHPRLLGVPGEQELAGMGVSYCAACDGAFFKDKVTAVVGGGDAAVEDAIFLSRVCRKVYLVHRRDQLRAARILQDRLMELNNVEILWDSQVEEILGEDQVAGVKIRHTKSHGDNKEDSGRELIVDGIFIAIGVVPNNQGLEGIASTDENGYFVAGEDCRTDTPGIFAAGDIRTKPLRQIVTAAADGANAAASALEYVEIHGIVKGCKTM